ncbi:MAG: glycosyltransferase family 4 protein [Phormidesmis sp.]
MKVAFINQPWNSVTAPVSAGSIPIWTYETARRFVQDTSIQNSPSAQDPSAQDPSAQATQSGHQAVIYARRDGQQSAAETCEGIEYRRVSVAGMRHYDKMAAVGERLFPSLLYIGSWFYSLPYILRIAVDLRRQQCDVAHVHNFSQFVPVIKLFNPKIKVVLHMHCEWLNQFERTVIAKRLAQTDLIVGCSDYITNKIKARFPEFSDRCQRVFNGVDINQFKPAEAAVKEVSIKEAAVKKFALQAATHKKSALQETVQINDTDEKTGPNVLFVGRISPEKGLHTLIEAFSKLTEHFPTARLHIVGPNQPTASKFLADLSDDPLVSRLSEFGSVNYLAHLKEKLPSKLKDQVFFPGAVSHQALHHYFQTSDILVNPSVSESFGMSLVEAMAAGISTVATQVGGMADVVVSGETGLLVSPEQPDELAIAMAQLLSDRTLRAQFGKAGRARAVGVFSWEMIASDLKHCYIQMLGPNESPKGSFIGQLPVRVKAHRLAMKQPQMRDARS